MKLKLNQNKLPESINEVNENSEEIQHLKKRLAKNEVEKVVIDTFSRGIQNFIRSTSPEKIKVKQYKLFC